MIVVTGAAGFIGSCLVAHLNNLGHSNLILVDDFSAMNKVANLEGKQFAQKIDRKVFLSALSENYEKISFVFHIGARTDTTELDESIFDELNVNYTKSIWKYCCEKQIPLVYASSAATYGGGELGYNDSHDIAALKPLNPYGQSKQTFDLWALQQEQRPPLWAGLKFFNVYGPNEYHKQRMASVIFHAFNQIQATGHLKLFRSHKDDFEDGQQSRDFVYVKDLVRACTFFMEQDGPSGLYNIGTGTARPFYDLGVATFRAMGVAPAIEFIDTPIDIRDTYQYFTEANMEKLTTAGFPGPWSSLEEGVEDYVKNYLIPGKYF